MHFFRAACLVLCFLLVCSFRCDLQLEDVEETLPPLLDPVLRRSEAPRRSGAGGGTRKIKLGGQEIDLDENFLLYMSTKLSNPHYLPEVSLKVFTHCMQTDRHAHAHIPALSPDSLSISCLSIYLSLVSLSFHPQCM